VALTLDVSADSVEVSDGSRMLARYLLDPDVPASESPRPFLHPVRTRAGRVVTDFRPADHSWHHGISLALPFVGHANLWGGPSWDAAAAGYLDRGDDGSMRHEALEVDEAECAIAQRLIWLDSSGAEIVRERRRLAFSVTEAGWAIDWTSDATNTTGEPLVFGSPATNGRVDAGYGGIFVRAAPSFLGGALAMDGTPVDEADFRGRRATTASLTARDGGARVTITSRAADTPWFARTSEYPGIGPAPFSTEESVVRPGDALRFSCSIEIADARALYPI
jgi:hypothetical protein